MYRFSNTADDRVIDHADHSAEEWHAYLDSTALAQAHIPATASGFVCHTCQLVIVETFGGC